MDIDNEAEQQKIKNDYPLIKLSKSTYNSKPIIPIPSSKGSKKRI